MGRPWRGPQACAGALTGKTATRQTPPTHLSCRREQPSMSFQLTSTALLAAHHCPIWNIPLPPWVSIPATLPRAQSSLGRTAVSPAQRDTKLFLHNNLLELHAQKTLSDGGTVAAGRQECSSTPELLQEAAHKPVPCVHVLGHAGLPGGRRRQLRSNLRRACTQDSVPPACPGSADATICPG